MGGCSFFICRNKYYCLIKCQAAHSNTFDPGGFLWKQLPSGISISFPLQVHTALGRALPEDRTGYTCPWPTLASQGPCSGGAIAEKQIQWTLGSNRSG